MKKLDLTNFQDLSFLITKLTEAQSQKVFFTASKKTGETISISLFKIEKKGILRESPLIASIIEKDIAHFEYGYHILDEWITKKTNKFFLGPPVKEKKVIYYFEEYDEFICFFNRLDSYFNKNIKTYFGLESIITFVFSDEEFIELLATQSGLVINKGQK
jgi:hypothetical protein